MSNFINFWARAQATFSDITVTVDTSNGLAATATKYAERQKVSVNCGGFRDDPEPSLDFDSMHDTVERLGGSGTEMATGSLTDSDVKGLTEALLAEMAYGLLKSLDRRS